MSTNVGKRTLRRKTKMPNSPISNWNLCKRTMISGPVVVKIWKTSSICKNVHFPNWNVKAFLHTLNFTVSQIQSEKLIFQLHQGKTWRSYDWAEYKGKHYALVAVSIDWCKIVMLWFFWLYKFKLWQLDLPVVHLRPRVGRPSHGWEQIPTQAWNWS